MTTPSWVTLAAQGGVRVNTIAWACMMRSTRLAFDRLEALLAPFSVQ